MSSILSGKGQFNYQRSPFVDYVTLDAEMGFKMAPDRRVVRTRRALRQAFEELVMEEPPQKITVTAITKRADVDRKTFYLHFTSIDDMIHSFIVDALEDLDELPHGIVNLNEPIDINAIYQELDEALEENIEFLRHLAKNPDFSMVWSEMEVLLKEHVLQTLAGQIKADPQELDLYAEFLASGIVSVYAKWLKNEIGLSHDQFIKSVSKICYLGLNDIAALNRT